MDRPTARAEIREVVAGCGRYDVITHTHQEGKAHSETVAFSLGSYREAIDHRWTVIRTLRAAGIEVTDDLDPSTASGPWASDLVRP